MESSRWPDAGASWQGAPTSTIECEGYRCTSNSDVRISMCLSCGSNYCDICWEVQGPHQPGKVGLDGMPHERTDKNTYERLRVILEPTANVEEISRLHTEDEDTTWFGIEKDTTGQPIFQDYGRYPALMAETKQPNGGLRYPQLVSFVGQTGAGKSTLIKMLVSLKEKKLTFSLGSPFKSPVVGSMRNDRSPTSGDVHLYADPETAFGPLPMLYADCEGLEGGDIAPVANQHRETMKKAGQAHIQRLFSSRPRELVYAKTNSEAMNREWAVKKVYPRLLYTFSDVVVFVLRNTRTFESSALRLLLDWASTSLESSINQPTLPHAIIVLNATPTAVDPEEWDIATATARLMQHIANAVHDVSFFVKYRDHWRRKGKSINDMLELIRCYYADICVVRIPTGGRYMLINDQVNKLHQRIVSNCDASFTAKHDAHMLSNTDELNSYLQAGFDHFTTKEDQPFNFVEVALKNNPIPRDFGDHILGIAANLRDVTGIRNGPVLFQKLSHMVASSIFVDCTRQRRPGKAQDLFDQFYVSSCEAALEHFCNKYWPCSFVSRKGKPCANVKSSHSAKGHQDVKGKVISTGQYRSEFSFSNFGGKWQGAIKSYLQDMEKKLIEMKNNSFPMRHGGAIYSDDELVYDLHRRHMYNFYASFEGFTAVSFSSLTTCFSCLMEVPQHPLQCGHILCTACVKAYGRQNDRNSVIMESCPLHLSHPSNSNAWMVHFKPEYAGVRVLSLDGGGMRGIIELEVLRAVEQALGGIPIQAFFDLIVGTSTGGIIALGLGVKQWSLNHCVTEFVRLCDRAFSPRELHKVAGLQQATTLAHGSKYRTQPLREALRNVFGGEYLYAGPAKGYKTYDTKVAVTATSGTGQTAVILANYSRQEETELNYRFEFPHKLQVWEAASATSAAPSFFKPFEGSNRQTYMDGALYFNNPVKVANHERKFLWPDVAENPPDIILSIGTGMNARLVQEALQTEVSEQHTVRQAKPASKKGMFGWITGKNKTKARNVKGLKLVSKYFSVLVNRIDNILNAELEWKQFCMDTVDNKSSTEDNSRYIRLNVDLGRDPPKLDEKAELTTLQSLTGQVLRTSEYQHAIENIAHRLVASSFYFLKENCTDFDENSQMWICTGRVVCRFEGNSSEYRANMRSLGDFMRRQQGPGYQPYFSIKEKAEDPDIQKIMISEQMIEDMVRRAEFRFADPIKIKMASQLSSTIIFLAICETNSFQPNRYPISGFPRRLIVEDTVNATRLDKRAELIRERRYGASIVANDPKVASPSTDSSDSLHRTVRSSSTDADSATLVSSETDDATTNASLKSTTASARPDERHMPKRSLSSMVRAVDLSLEQPNKNGSRSLHKPKSEPIISISKLRSDTSNASSNNEILVVDAEDQMADPARYDDADGLSDSSDSDGPPSDDEEEGVTM